MGELDNLTGMDVGGYRLIRELGSGADGIVYAALREDLEVAVKLFFPSAIKKNGLAEARERLELQLALIGKKIHPNLVEIYAGGELHQLATLYLVMELVPGVSLDKLIGKIPPEVVPFLAAQLADVTHELEKLGLVHRDIKPANIVISDDFAKLTLLDLGIIHQIPIEEGEQNRLSGMEFVATLRYSPPEFVWRSENEHEEEAWRAITFYQIGATLHDMIMGKPLFSGNDTPRACLYDAVRDLTPEVQSEHIPGWLIQTVQACLLKDWRQRLKFVCWENFVEPTGGREQHQQENRIRLQQLRRTERRLAKDKQTKPERGPSREQELWRLNNTLSLEIRTYLLNSPIFPKFRVNEAKNSPTEYGSQIIFDSDESLAFPAEVNFIISLSIDSDVNEATKLTVNALIDDSLISSATWVELFTVEAALGNCQQAFLDAVEIILSS